MAIKISKNRLDIDGKPLQNVLHQDLDHTTTPANPPAGNLRIYAKSDNKIYKLTPAGAETEVGGVATTTRYLWLDAGSAIVPTGATADAGAERVLVESASSIRIWYELRYDASTNENAGWSIALPTSWDAGQITATIYWKAAATSGDVSWIIYYQALGDDDVWDTGVSQAGTPIVDTAKGTSEDLNTAAYPFTPTGSASDSLRLWLRRQGGDGGDTMTGDAKVLGVLLSIGVTL